MKKYYLIAGAILLAISAVSLSRHQAQVRPKISANPSSTETVNAEDQTYTSARFGFSFRYPRDWKTVEIADGKGILLTSRKVQYSVEGGTDDAIITVSVYNQNEIIPHSIDNYQKLAINGFEVYRYDTDPKGGIDVFIKFGSKYARIINYASTPGFDFAKVPEYNAVFEDLIQSFRYSK